MPQMAPYNWLCMFMLFNLINLLIISINYYLKLPTFNFTLKTNFIKKFNFKW